MGATDAALRATMPTALLVAALAVPPPATAEPLHLLVDPTQPPGDGVVASLAAAIAAAQSAPAGTTAIAIDLAPGVHVLDATVPMGALPAPTQIRGLGAEPTATRLLGGVRLRARPQEVAPDDPVRARLPAAALDTVRWIDVSVAPDQPPLAGLVRHGMNLPAGAGSELFWNGRPLTTARWPDVGFAPIDGIVDAGSSKDRPEPGDARRGGTFRVADRERLARWAAAEQVWLSGYWHWDWADDSLPAGRIDATTGTITLGLPHTYGLGKDARFAVLGIPEELDAPGEYWLDIARQRAYFVPPDATGEPEIVVSLLAGPLLELAGTRDLTLANVQLEAGRGVAIAATDVTDVRIEHCSFRNTGTGAIELAGHHCAIVDCAFADIGAAGVLLTGGDRSTLTHGDNEVRGCTFRRCGRTHRTYQPAIRLDGVGQTVAGNRIEDLPHCALIFAGNEHRIERNDIGRVLLETGDSGAIYCGRDWTLHGTVIRHNLFHDIQGSDARYQNAVYLDDLASGITVEGNVFVRCNWGVLVGGGRDNHIRGNVFVACRKGISFDQRGVGWMATAIADPATSTLHQRLRAVPIDREPWRSRYPTLGAYLSDRFGRPVGSEVTGNVFLATPLGRIDDRECVRVEGNVVAEQGLGADLVAALLEPAARRRLPALRPPAAPESFVPIPVADIGVTGR